MNNDKLKRLAYMYNEKYYTASYSSKDSYRTYEVKINPIQISKIHHYGTINTIPDKITHDIKIRVSALVKDSFANMNEISWEGNLQDWYEALLNDVKENVDGK